MKNTEHYDGKKIKLRTESEHKGNHKCEWAVIYITKIRENYI